MNLSTMRNNIANFARRSYERLQRLFTTMVERTIQHIDEGLDLISHQAARAWHWFRASRVAVSIANHIPNRVQNAPHFVVEQASRPVNWLWTRAQSMAAPFRSPPPVSPIAQTMQAEASPRPGS